MEGCQEEVGDFGLDYDTLFRLPVVTTAGEQRSSPCDLESMLERAVLFHRHYAARGYARTSVNPKTTVGWLESLLCLRAIVAVVTRARKRPSGSSQFTGRSPVLIALILSLTYPV